MKKIKYLLLAIIAFMCVNAKAQVTRQLVDYGPLCEWIERGCKPANSETVLATLERKYKAVPSRQSLENGILNYDNDLKTYGGRVVSMEQTTNGQVHDDWAAIMCLVTRYKRSVAKNKLAEAKSTITLLSHELVKYCEKYGSVMTDDQKMRAKILAKLLESW